MSIIPGKEVITLSGPVGHLEWQLHVQYQEVLRERTDGGYWYLRYSTPYEFSRLHLKLLAMSIMTHFRLIAKVTIERESGLSFGDFIYLVKIDVSPSL